MTDKKPSRFGRIWSFLESPFTWGGIGVIVGAAATSPSWFKYAFIGAGVAIAVGALRAGFSYPKSRSSRIAAALTCLVLFAVWLKVWNIVPKPTDPLTKQDLRDVLKEMLPSSTQSAVTTEPSSIERPDTSRALIRTKEDLVTAVRQVLSELSGHQPVQSGAQPASLSSPAQSSPEINSAPTIFRDGRIMGSGFGTRPGRIYLHIRVKSSAQQGRYAPGDFIGPDQLLGGLVGSNYPVLPDGVIQEWKPDSIQLKFQDAYWSNLWLSIERVAAQRNVAPPARSDLEVGYQVERADDEQKSQWFYPQ